MNAGKGIRSCAQVLVGCVVAAVANAVTDDATLQVGELAITYCPPVPPNIGAIVLEGYGGDFFGSYSPTALTGGTTVADVQDVTGRDGCFVANRSRLSISGFSSDPGIGWLTSITCNNVMREGANATYEYNRYQGIASWTWQGRTFGFTNGATVGCSIDHH